jgi:hypothetical protein
MFIPERWVVLKFRLEGPFVVIEFRAPGSKIVLFSAIWGGISALSFQSELSGLRDLILGEAEKLPFDRQSPHALAPVPLPIFLDLPRGLEHRLYHFVELGLGELWSPVPWSPGRLQPVLLHRGKWVRRSLFRLPFVIQTVGSESHPIGSAIWDPGWSFAGPVVREFGIRVESGDAYEPNCDIVVTNDRALIRAVSATPLERRPRLLVIWGSSLELPPEVSAGVALCEIAGNQLDAARVIQELIFGLIHDFPLHEAVASVMRKTPTKLRLIADPRSNQSLRIQDALESVKREGIQWETKVGAVFTAAAVKPDLPVEKVADTARLVRNVVADFKNFERETTGLVPLANLESTIATSGAASMT